MKNLVLDQIKTEAVKILTGAYGYCGVADSDHVALLNSGGDTENIVVKIADAVGIEKARQPKTPATATQTSGV